MTRKYLTKKQRIELQNESYIPIIDENINISWFSSPNKIEKKYLNYKHNNQYINYFKIHNEAKCLRSRIIFKYRLHDITEVFRHHTEKYPILNKRHIATLGKEVKSYLKARSTNKNDRHACKKLLLQILTVLDQQKSSNKANSVPNHFFSEENHTTPDSDFNSSVHDIKQTVCKEIKANTSIILENSEATSMDRRETQHPSRRLSHVEIRESDSDIVYGTQIDCDITDINRITKYPCKEINMKRIETEEDKNCKIDQRGQTETVDNKIRILSDEKVRVECAVIDSPTRMNPVHSSRRNTVLDRAMYNDIDILSKNKNDNVKVFQKTPQLYTTLEHKSISGKMCPEVPIIHSSIIGGIVNNTIRLESITTEQSQTAESVDKSEIFDSTRNINNTTDSENKSKHGYKNNSDSDKQTSLNQQNNHDYTENLNSCQIRFCENETEIHNTIENTEINYETPVFESEMLSGESLNLLENLEKCINVSNAYRCEEQKKKSRESIQNLSNIVNIETECIQTLDFSNLENSKNQKTLETSERSNDVSNGDATMIERIVVSNKQQCRGVKNKKNIIGNKGVLSSTQRFNIEDQDNFVSVQPLDEHFPKNDICDQVNWKNMIDTGNCSSRPVTYKNQKKIASCIETIDCREEINNSKSTQKKTVSKQFHSQNNFNAVKLDERKIDLSISNTQNITESNMMINNSQETITTQIFEVDNFDDFFGSFKKFENQETNNNTDSENPNEIHNAKSTDPECLRERHKLSNRLTQQINFENVACCETVQKNVQTEMYEQGSCDELSYNFINCLDRCKRIESMNETDSKYTGQIDQIEFEEKQSDYSKNRITKNVPENKQFLEYSEDIFTDDFPRDLGSNVHSACQISNTEKCYKKSENSVKVMTQSSTNISKMIERDSELINTETNIFDEQIKNKQENSQKLYEERNSSQLNNGKTIVKKTKRQTKNSSKTKYSSKTKNKKINSIDIDSVIFMDQKNKPEPEKTPETPTPTLLNMNLRSQSKIQQHSQMHDKHSGILQESVENDESHICDKPENETVQVQNQKVVSETVSHPAENQYREEIGSSFNLENFETSLMFCSDKVDSDNIVEAIDAFKDHLFKVLSLFKTLDIQEKRHITESIESKELQEENEVVRERPIQSQPRKYRSLFMEKSNLEQKPEPKKPDPPRFNMEIEESINHLAQSLQDELNEDRLSQSLPDSRFDFSQKNHRDVEHRFQKCPHTDLYNLTNKTTDTNSNHLNRNYSDSLIDPHPESVDRKHIDLDPEESEESDRKSKRDFMNVVEEEFERNLHKSLTEREKDFELETLTGPVNMNQQSRGVNVQNSDRCSRSQLIFNDGGSRLFQGDQPGLGLQQNNSVVSRSQRNVPFYMSQVPRQEPSFLQSNINNKPTIPLNMTHEVNIHSSDRCSYIQPTFNDGSFQLFKSNEPRLDLQQDNSVFKQRHTNKPRKVSTDLQSNHGEIPMIHKNMNRHTQDMNLRNSNRSSHIQPMYSSDSFELFCSDEPGLDLQHDQSVFEQRHHNAPSCIKSQNCAPSYMSQEPRPVFSNPRSNIIDKSTIHTNMIQETQYTNLNNSDEFSNVQPIASETNFQLVQNDEIRLDLQQSMKQDNDYFKRKQYSTPSYMSQEPRTSGYLKSNDSERIYSTFPWNATKSEDKQPEYNIQQTDRQFDPKTFTPRPTNNQRSQPTYLNTPPNRESLSARPMKHFHSTDPTTIQNDTTEQISTGIFKVLERIQAEQTIQTPNQFSVKSYPQMTTIQKNKAKQTRVKKHEKPNRLTLSSESVRSFRTESGYSTQSFTQNNSGKRECQEKIVNVRRRMKHATRSTEYPESADYTKGVLRSLQIHNSLDERTGRLDSGDFNRVPNDVDLFNRKNERVRNPYIQNRLSEPNQTEKEIHFRSYPQQETINESERYLNQTVPDRYLNRAHCDKYKGHEFKSMQCDDEDDDESIDEDFKQDLNFGEPQNFNDYFVANKTSPVLKRTHGMGPAASRKQNVPKRRDRDSQIISDSIKEVAHSTMNHAVRRKLSDYMKKVDRENQYWLKADPALSSTRPPDATQRCDNKSTRCAKNLSETNDTVHIQSNVGYFPSLSVTQNTADGSKTDNCSGYYMSKDQMEAKAYKWVKKASKENAAKRKHSRFPVKTGRVQDNRWMRNALFE